MTQHADHNCTLQNKITNCINKQIKLICIIYSAVPTMEKNEG